MTPMGWEETARSGLLQSWNPKNSGAFRKNSYPGVGGWTTTAVAFLFMCDFSTFPRGAGKKLKEVGVPKNPPLGKTWSGRGTCCSTPTRPSSAGSAGALTSWAMSLPRRGWMSPRRRWNGASNGCPGFMSKMWTGNHYGAGEDG